MALDWTNPGGPALAQQYVQIMHGSAAQAQQLSAQDYEGDDSGDDITAAAQVTADRIPVALRSRIAWIRPPPEQPLAERLKESVKVTTWSQVLWVLDNMWWRYEEFVMTAKRAFKIRRVVKGPRELRLRWRFTLRTEPYRGLGLVAAAAAQDARDRLVEANEALRSRCYDPPGDPDYYNGHPPTAPEGRHVSTSSLTVEAMAQVGGLLQLFRDALANAVLQVRAYIDVLSSDAQQRQAWFDNAMKLISAVTALGGALKPM